MSAQTTIMFTTTTQGDTDVKDATPLPVTLSGSGVGDLNVEGKTAHDAAGTSTNPVAVGGYASATIPTAVSTAIDVVRAWFDLNGAFVTRDAGTVFTTVIGVSGAQVATTDNTLTAVTDAPTSGQKIVVDDVLISADAACNVLFEIETTGTDLFQIYFAGAGTIQFTPRGKLKLATADKKLTSKASTTVNVKILVLFHSEA